MTISRSDPGNGIVKGWTSWDHRRFGSGVYQIEINYPAGPILLAAIEEALMILEPCLVARLVWEIETASQPVTGTLF